MLKYFRNAVLGLLAFAFGIGLGAFDFLYHQFKAGGHYSIEDYTQLQIDRFDGNGGTLGLVFRKSTRVTPHLPDAPEGWQAHVWSTVPDAKMYSRAQREARRRHLVSAVPDIGYMDGMSQAEERLFDVYLDDVSRMYSKADGALIDLKVTVPGLEIGSRHWQRYQREILAYYKHMDESSRFGSFAGLQWLEHVGPVERAANLTLDHELRKFSADLGPVLLEVRARAREQDIHGFLTHLDMDGLRALAAKAPERAPLPERAAPKFIDSWPRNVNGAVIASLEDCSDPRPRISKVVFCY